jgi:hypothetical protein
VLSAHSEHADYSLMVSNLGLGNSMPSY